MGIFDFTKIFGKKNYEKKLYDIYADRFFNLSYRYLKSNDDAEEALNNGFLKIFKNYLNFVNQSQNNFEAWMRKIMVNECLMILRKKKSLREVQEELASNYIATNQSDEEINMEDYFAILLKLPEGYRTVFNLYAIEGYSHAEIAEMLGIKESTSRSQLTKAREMLKKLLHKENTLNYIYQ